MQKFNPLTAVKQLDKKYQKLVQSIPQKYQSTISNIINAEYILTMIEEGHEATSYEYEILNILNNK
jgi:hypothetical protein